MSKLIYVLILLFIVQIYGDKCYVKNNICSINKLDKVMKYLCNMTYNPIDEMYHDEIFNKCCMKKCNGAFLCPYCPESCCYITIDYD